MIVCQHSVVNENITLKELGKWDQVHVGKDSSEVLRGFLVWKLIN
jgi:hypothetical protein